MSVPAQLLLNLDNFENECLRKSTPYVLTSPTSLRACSKLLVEPSELIYRSLEQYEEELAGLPLSEIYRIYDENETERQEKLLRCRQVRRSLQLKPSEEQRARLVFLRQAPADVSRMKSDSSKGHGGERETGAVSPPATESHAATATASSSSRRKHVVLQYSSDTESVEGDYHHEIQQSSSSNNVTTSTTTIANAAAAKTTSPVNELRHRRCKSESKSTTLPPLALRKSASPARMRTQTRRIQSSSSVPNLTNKPGNLNFRKVIPTTTEWQQYSTTTTTSSCLTGFHHHHPCHYLCQCPQLHLATSDKELIDAAMKRYGDLITGNHQSCLLTSDDQRILQSMLLKKGRAMEWEKRAHELRRMIEQERLQRARNSQLANQRWYDQLAEKRRLENLQNSQRYLSLQERDSAARDNLLKFLENRDRRVQNYLTRLADEKNSQICERHKLETVRQLEVGKAIQRILEQDQENRVALADNLQKRMENAELRKRRREQDQWRHICEMNRLDEEKRQLKHDLIEKATQNSIQQLRNQLEEKEARGYANYLEQLRRRHNLPKDRGRRHEEAILKAQQLHSQLLQGLDDWYKKIFELHLAAQERASLNYRSQLTSRRARLTAERCLREEKTAERLRVLQAEESKKRAQVKTTIESKEARSVRLKQEKERRVQFLRRRAQYGAELRQQLRDKVDPDTFDKKVARVEIELRLLKHSGGSYSRFKGPFNGSGNVFYHRPNYNSSGGGGKSRSLEYKPTTRFAMAEPCFSTNSKVNNGSGGGSRICAGHSHSHARAQLPPTPPQRQQLCSCSCRCRSRSCYL